MLEIYSRFHLYPKSKTIQGFSRTLCSRNNIIFWVNNSPFDKPLLNINNFANIQLTTISDRLMEIYVE